MTLTSKLGRSPLCTRTSWTASTMLGRIIVQIKSVVDYQHSRAINNQQLSLHPAYRL